LPYYFFNKEIIKNVDVEGTLVICFQMKDQYERTTKDLKPLIKNKNKAFNKLNTQSDMIESKSTYAEKAALEIYIISVRDFLKNVQIGNNPKDLMKKLEKYGNHMGEIKYLSAAKTCNTLCTIGDKDKLLKL